MAQGLAHASNMENLRQMVQKLCSGTSDRFVPEPYQKYVQSDILIAIRGFKNVVRWKEFWRDQKKSTEPEENEIEEESRVMATGLNTGLKHIFGVKAAKHGSDNLKGFLIAVGKTLLKEAFKRRRFDRQNRKTVEIYDVLQELKKSGCVCVLTDKTNATRVIKIKDYKRWVSAHLQKAADLALRPKVMALYENANLLLRESEVRLISQGRGVCETIASDESGPVSKDPNQRPQDNQQERGISNQVGHPCDKLYRNFLQDRLPWNKKMPGQGKSELFT